MVSGKDLLILFQSICYCQYLPDIFKGIWITLELSILIVSGILLGCILVLRV